ncbi:MAG: hypothetical protein DRI46_05030 [Chloroflexi bacterium]|nr:MAG: hypothetical protein DRI46_05030 [Chloroflexota bacterium]
MDYGKLFTRAWDTLWKNAFLILLGVLVVLGSGNSGGASQSRYLFESGEFPWREMRPSDFGGAFTNGDFAVLALGGIVLLGIAVVLFGLVFWALGLIARGGMISAVNDLENGKSAGFITAFQAGWDKGWKLLGIGLVPAIPGLILAVTVVTTLVFSGIGFNVRRGLGLSGIRNFAPLLFLFCLFVPVMMLASALRTFANRSCMLENTGVIGSYRRGVEVLGDNLGPALVLFILQVVINIVLGIVFLLPFLLAALCCLLWPLLILIQAAFAAFYSILWTLAWREWVGSTSVAD